MEQLLNQVLPPKGEAWAIPEGETIERREIVLRISAPYRSFGIYETAILGTLAQESGWASAARACVEAAGGIPVIHFGARHVHPVVSARLEYAAVVGGCVGCATPAGAALAGIDPSGEEGEYHTVVTSGPIFSRQIPIRQGSTITKGGYWFLDISLASAS